MLTRAKTAAGVKTDLAFAEFLGINPSVVAGYKRRDTVPLEQCIKMAEKTGVNLDWLILGKGHADNSNCAQDGTPIALYDVAASAGCGTFFDSENITQHIPFNSAWLKREGLHKKDLLCLPIRGDSMTPGLIDGDIVLINRRLRTGDGVFVLRINEALRIKRLQWRADGSLRISSDNPLYEAEYINPEELIDDFEIIGAVHTKIGRVS